MINLTIIHNAKFNSTNIFYDLSNIYSCNSCICQCYAISNCIIANYFGLYQKCKLFSSSLQLKNLLVMSTNENAFVIVFNDRNQTDAVTMYQTSSISTMTTMQNDQCNISLNPLHIYINSPMNDYVEEIYYYQASFNGTAILEFGFRAKNVDKVWYLDDVSIVDINASNLEMLRNGNFELGSLTNWQIVCTNTNCRGIGGVIDQSDCHQGFYCYKGGCQDKYDFLRQSFNVIDGHVYNITYWIKTIGNLDEYGYIDIRPE